MPLHYNEFQENARPSSYFGLKKEISRLNDITSGSIIMSRFHYLRFSLPESYQILIEAGIKEDYSMGYVDRIGFRAGTCTPFYFYDLNNEKTSEVNMLKSCDVSFAQVFEGAYPRSSE